jgi:hypothetical protein
MVGTLGPLFRTGGQIVRTQHGVTASAGQRRGDVEIRSFLQDAAGRRSLVFDLSMTHDRFGSSSHVQQNGLLSHPQDLDAPCVLLRSAKLTATDNNTLTIRTFLFSPRLSAQAHACTASFCVFFFYRPTGRPRALHCRWNVIATQPIGLVSFQARGILPVAEEQSRTRGSQSSGVEDQPQCQGMWHSRRPSARSLSRYPSPPPPSFKQSPSPPRSLVRDGQTSPHRPRLVVSRSTCPPLSPSPRANSFIIGTALINTHTHNKHTLLPLRIRILHTLTHTEFG